MTFKTFKFWPHLVLKQDTFMTGDGLLLWVSSSPPSHHYPETSNYHSLFVSIILYCIIVALKTTLQYKSFLHLQRWCMHICTRDLCLPVWDSTTYFYISTPRAYPHNSRMEFIESEVGACRKVTSRSWVVKHPRCFGFLSYRQTARRGSSSSAHIWRVRRNMQVDFFFCGSAGEQNWNRSYS